MDLCGAKTRTGEPCRRRAGWGTKHFGTGRCKAHGGASTGPAKGTKNALKTGENEHIGFKELDDDEQKLWHEVQNDPLKLCETGIRFLEIRERRMLIRIQTLKSEADADGMTTVAITDKNGFGAQGPVDVTETRREGVLGQIQAIEEALTRVQTRKQGYIELLVKVKQGTGDDENLLKLATNIQEMSGQPVEMEGING